MSTLAWLFQSETVFAEGQASWTQEMVSAVQEIVKIYGWQAFCKTEDIQVTMFEEACAHFKAVRSR